MMEVGYGVVLSADVATGEKSAMIQKKTVF